MVGVAEGLLDLQQVVGGAADIVGRVVRVLDTEGRVVDVIAGELTLYLARWMSGRGILL